MGRASLIALVLAVMLGPPAADAAVAPSQQISSDPFTNAGAQHATEVEPDTFSFGDTVVAAFQVGRFRDGGATTIGWATSTDGGSSWTSGFLPSLTVFSAPAGRFSRVSDPAVAYDRAHGVWLISVLGWRDTGGIAPVSSLVVSRSPDGLRWSAPVTTAPEVGSFAHDKNWVVCDSGAASRFGGRCYTTWTDVTSAGALAVSTSLDGGLTWGVPVVGRTGEITGSQPVVRPDGVLVIPYLNDGGVAAVRSTDGGVSLGTPVRVSRLAGSQPPGLRAPPLPSAEVDAGGRVYVAWPDCRFRPRCERPGRRPGNDMVLSSSADGRTWTEPAAVPIGGSDQLLPGLGVDPTTQGTSARLALAYYALTPAGCTAAACRLGAGFIASPDGGRTWSRPLALSEPAALTAFADTPPRGRFVGDYISTSFVGNGVAVPVYSAATAPFDGSFHQAVFAARVLPLPAAPTAGAPRVRITRLTVVPSPPRAGRSFRVAITVSSSAPLAGARAVCSARLGGRPLRVSARPVAGNRATCAGRIPASAAGKRLTGSVTLRHPRVNARGTFSYVVGK